MAMTCQKHPVGYHHGPIEFSAQLCYATGMQWLWPPTEESCICICVCICICICIFIHICICMCMCICKCICIMYMYVCIHL